MPRRSEGALHPKNDRCRELGAWFRQTRERRQISLTHLAGRMDMCIMTIRKHESGHLLLRADDLERAASVMDVDAAFLLKGGTYEQSAGGGTAAE